MRNFQFLAFFIFCCATSAKASDKHLELNTSVNFYTGDAFRSMTLGSASAIYRHNDSFWFGADFTGGLLRIDRANGIGIKSGDALYLANGTFYWNMLALLNASKKDDKDAILSDFYTSIGVGNMWIGSRREPFGFVGGGLVIHTPLSWLSVRFDLKNLFFNLENNEGYDFNSDLALALGTSFLF